MLQVTTSANGSTESNGEQGQPEQGPDAAHEITGQISRKLEWLDGKEELHLEGSNDPVTRIGRGGREILESGARESLRGGVANKAAELQESREGLSQLRSLSEAGTSPDRSEEARAGVCVVRIENTKESRSRGHEFKVLSLMVTEGVVTTGRGWDLLGQVMARASSEQAKVHVPE